MVSCGTFVTPASRFFAIVIKWTAESLLHKRHRRSPDEVEVVSCVKDAFRI